MTARYYLTSVAGQVYDIGICLAFQACEYVGKLRKVIVAFPPFSGVGSDLRRRSLAAAARRDAPETAIFAKRRDRGAAGRGDFLKRLVAVDVELSDDLFAELELQLHGCFLLVHVSTTYKPIISRFLTRFSKEF